MMLRIIKILVGILLLVQTEKSSGSDLSANNGSHPVSHPLDSIPTTTGQLHVSSVYSPREISPTPKCWKLAVLAFDYMQNERIIFGDAKNICASLPEHHQKALALEITRCHLQDLRRPLVEDPEVQIECNRPLTEASDLFGCLPFLTDTAALTYTQYVAYVQNLCIRLTQEIIMQQQQEVHRDLVSKYVETSGTAFEQFERLAALMEEHEILLVALSTIPHELQESLQRDLTITLERTVENTLEKHLEQQLQAHLEIHLSAQVRKLLETQSTEHAIFFEGMLDRLELRDEETRQQYESWTHYMTAAWQSQAVQLESQHKRMEEHRKKVETISEMAITAAQKLQPLVKLESMVRVLVSGYSWIVLLLYFLVTFNIVWLATRPKRCKRFRSYLYFLIILEAAIEVSLTAMCHREVISRADRIHLIREARQWTVLLECSIYVLGMVVSLFVSHDRDATSPWTIQRSVEAISKRQHEMIQSLRSISLNQSTANQVGHSDVRPSAVNSVNNYNPSQSSSSMIYNGKSLSNQLQVISRADGNFKVQPHDTYTGLIQVESEACFELPSTIRQPSCLEETRGQNLVTPASQPRLGRVCDVPRPLQVPIYRASPIWNDSGETSKHEILSQLPDEKSESTMYDSTRDSMIDDCKHHEEDIDCVQEEDKACDGSDEEQGFPCRKRNGAELSSVAAKKARGSNDCFVD